MELKKGNFRKLKKKMEGNVFRISKDCVLNSAEIFFSFQINYFFTKITGDCIQSYRNVTKNLNELCKTFVCNI